MTSTSARRVDGVDGDPGQRGLDRMRPEQLVDQRPDHLQRGLHPAVRFGGAVAEPDDPAGRVVAVVGQFLDALGRDRRQHRVFRGTQGVELGQPPRREHQQPGQHLGEVGVGPFHQPDVAEFPLVAPERELVLVAVGSVGLAGPGQQHPGLPEQVERDVADRGLFLELGRAGHPLLQAVAAGSVRRRRASGNTSASASASTPSGTVVSTPSRASVNPVPKAQRWSSVSSRECVRGEVVLQIRHRALLHMCGTSSGMS